MGELGAIVVGTVLANNFVLTKFLGLCPFLGTASRMESALGMSLATTFVLTLACALGALVENELLRGLHLEHLRPLALILIIASTVQLTEILLRQISPLLYRVLGIFLPLITTNCAVLGVALFNVREGFDFLTAAFYGFFTAVGFSVVLVCFAALRIRLEDADVPGPFRGAPVALAAAGLMALAFQGFGGLGAR